MTVLNVKFFTVDVEYKYVDYILLTYIICCFCLSVFLLLGINPIFGMNTKFRSFFTLFQQGLLPHLVVFSIDHLGCMVQEMVVSLLKFWSL